MQLPEIKSQYIGDTAIEYLEYGQSGPYILMLHATGFLPWLWQPIALRLSEKYRVIAPAMFKHREADPNQGGLGWLVLAEDLKKLCGALGLGKALYVGHSMGAAVITLAHTVLGLPVEKMVLIEPIFLPEATYTFDIEVQHHPLAAKAIKRRNHWRDRQEVMQDFKSKPFFQSWNDEILSLYVEHGTIPNNGDGVRLTCTPQQEAALFMGGMQHNPWPELPKVSCPAMIVEGQISTNRPWIDLHRVADLIPQGQYAEVEDAGHLVPMEKPTEVARIIEDFL